MAGAHSSSVMATNNTPALIQCAREVINSLCDISEPEMGRRDALAGLRLVVCTLSLLGASSIIYSSVRKRSVWSPKVSPLFVLSIADLLLALLWGVGSVLWLGRSEDMKRGWCLSVSLITVIVECAAINLTLVYALLAYSHIKKLDMGLKQTYGPGSRSVLTAGTGSDESGRSRYLIQSSVLYLVAWAVPLCVVMVPFAFLVTITNYHVLDFVKSCTCWCRPGFGNIIPISVTATNATARYMYEMDKILLLYAVVLSAHYLTVFLSLLLCYRRILRRIHRLNTEYDKYHGSRRYGTVKVQIKQAQSQARRRVVAFIAVFIVTGFANLVLSVVVLQHEMTQLLNANLAPHRESHELPLPIYLIFYLQSLTVPMQGFLNAIVYGWSRDDFVKTVVDPRHTDTHTDPPPDPQEASSEDDNDQEKKVLVQTEPSRDALRGTLSGAAAPGSHMINGGEAQTDFETDDDVPTGYKA